MAGIEHLVGQIKQRSPHELLGTLDSLNEDMPTLLGKILSADSHIDVDDDMVKCRSLMSDITNIQKKLHAGEPVATSAVTVLSQRFNELYIKYNDEHKRDIG